MTSHRHPFFILVPIWGNTTCWYSPQKSIAIFNHQSYQVFWNLISSQCIKELTRTDPYALAKSDHIIDNDLPLLRPSFRAAQTIVVCSQQPAIFWIKPFLNVVSIKLFLVTIKLSGCKITFLLHFLTLYVYNLLNLTVWGFSLLESSSHQNCASSMESLYPWLLST